MSQWIVDVIGEGFGQAIQVNDILYDHHSPYQRVQVAGSARFGRMLVLDDAVQTTEKDEYVYHEMLVHVPLVAHPAPRRVLIIGGGDGGTLEEALKHPVESVTMVEIDREVVDVSRRFLPAISGGAFDDPRSHLRIGDGVEFVRAAGERFDAILVDSTDPKGPGIALFSEEFYRACAAILTPSGVLAAQSGSPLYQHGLMESVSRHLSAVFPTVAPYWAAVPAYPGTLWSFTFASAAIDPRPSGDELSRRISSRSLGPLRYYTPGTHHAAFRLPAVP